MLYFAYCIPVITCLLLKFTFDYSGEWTSYLWTFIFGEAAVGGLHFFFYKSRTSATEYLGSIVTRIEHEDEWIELKEEKVTERDSNGNTYETIKIREIHHPEVYRYFTSLGNKYESNRFFFNHVSNKWDQYLHHVSWEGNHIKYGIRHGQSKDFRKECINDFQDHYKYVTLSEPHSYTNKIINSNSIFNFEKISKEEAKNLGLYEWPKPDEYNDAPAILSRKIIIDENIDKLYRRFNALKASENQMRLFILIFDANQGIAVAEKQKSYWKGGNKNEIIVCLGVDDDKQVKWAYTFSWAKENIVEVEVNQWFLSHSELDLHAFLAWFSFEHIKWERREFKEFDYIRVGLELWQYMVIMFGGIAMGAFSIYACLNH